MDGDATSRTARKQVVLYPSPGMGHLVSMIELGKLFATRGLAVTIVIVKLPSSFRLSRLQSNHPEGITFEVARVSNPHLRGFLAGATPAVLVVDFFCSVALDVAVELRIPAYCFYTSGAEVLAVNLYLPVLHDQTTANFRDMGEELVHVPGIYPFPASHTIKPLMDRDDAAYRGFLSLPPYLCRSQGIIVNTCRSLEPRAVDAICAGLCTPHGLPTPPIYCIGPLIESEEVGVKHGEECLAWLDLQPQASVVFLCFGSLGVFSAKQIREVAIGLEASGKRFLWVVRSPPNDDPAKKFEKPPEPDLDALLPEGFSWTGPRARVWSSSQSVMAGVPMLAWPLYAEQRMNRVFLEKELGLAVAVEGYDKDGGVEADEVASKVRWMMDSDGGRVLRERALAAMQQAKEALRDGRESDVTLARLVEAWMRA
ncbi:unnamed protein product [Alopecurus aequalis]